MAAIANVYAGGSGEALLRAEDPAESLVLQVVAVESARLERTREVRLARLIAQHVGKALGGK